MKPAYLHVISFILSMGLLGFYLIDYNPPDETKQTYQIFYLDGTIEGTISGPLVLIDGGCVVLLSTREIKYCFVKKIEILK